jgi:hypothetical protein
MRSCPRRLVLLALLVCSAPPATAAAQTGAVLELSGGPEASAIGVSTDPGSGELVVRDPGGIEPPGDPCEPASGTMTSEFRCPPGTIAAIVGSLGAGDDSLTLAEGIGIRVGARVDGRPRPLGGGPGRDRLRGGDRSDLLAGGDGSDLLLGAAGGDLLRGGLGADRLRGGAGADALLGGDGADRLLGGPGPDLCRGGGGPDRLVSCAFGRR